MFVKAPRDYSYSEKNTAPRKYTFRKIPVSMLPTYRGVGGIGLDAAYMVENDFGDKLGVVAKSGKEWVGYIETSHSVFKLFGWGARSRAEAFKLLMDEPEVKGTIY
jgi:hypothetical protein